MRDILSVEFRKRTIQAILRDPTFLKTTRRFIDPEDFPKGRERFAVSFILRYFDEFGSVPDEWVFEECSNQLNMDELELADFISEYFEEPKEVEFVRSRIVDFARNRKLETAMTEAAGVLGVASWDEIMGILRQAEVYGELEESKVVTLPGGEDTIGSMDQMARVPTGFSLVDDYTGGGLPVGHLGTILAPPNHGKSSFLIHHAATALRAGLSVIHFTLEMSTTQTFSRYNAAMDGVTKALKRKPRRRLRKGPTKRHKFGQAFLSIVEREPGSLTPSAMMEDVKKVSLDGGFKPGLIVIDYAALMRPPRHYDQKRHEIADIFRDLRAYARRSNIPIWTAHQGNRQSLSVDTRGSKVIGMEGLAEVFEVAAIVDLMYSINATEEEKQSEICRIFIAKNRLGENNKIGTVMCDFKRCKFVDDEMVDDDE